MKRIRWAAGRLLRRMGYELTSIKGHERFSRAGTVDAVKPYTLTTRDRITGLCDAVDYIVESGIRGAVVECGVWRGGSMMAVALTLLENGEVDRDLFLYDTFDGMVEPSDLDLDYRGVPVRDKWLRSNPRESGSDWIAVPKTEVEGAMATTGYPMDRVHMVEGRVEDTIPDVAPDEIALLRLDTDLYESYAHVLKHLADRVADGGVVIFDDYVHYLGAQRAVDEWVESWPRPLFLTRIGSARMAVLWR